MPTIKLLLSPARWFVIPWFTTSFVIGLVFALPIGLMFMNYAVKKNNKITSRDDSINMKQLRKRILAFSPALAFALPPLVLMHFNLMPLGVLIGAWASVQTYKRRRSVQPAAEQHL